MKKTTYYPVCLDIFDKRCIVIGGGKIAGRKTASLLSSGAKVIVVSPQLEASLARLVARGKVKYIKGNYQSRFLHGADLVIAATDKDGVNKAVSRDAKKRKLLINVVDAPALSSFIMPAVIRRGGITISISTGGRSPLFARWLKEELEKAIGPEYALFLRSMAKKRKAMQRRKFRKE